MTLHLLSRGLVRPLVLRHAPCLTFLRGYATKRYTTDHEWVSVENGIGTIGITDFAQKSLGDIVYVEFPSTGSTIEKYDTIGAVESVKAASDIQSPVSGVIDGINEILADEPALINESPEDEGWMIKVKLSDSDEVATLMDKSAYVKYCSSEDN